MTKATASSDLPNSLAEYSYDFEESSIAHYPSDRRDESKLLLVRRHPEGGLPRFEDLKFSELPHVVEQNSFLKDYLWVRNRTRVLPARLFAKRQTGSRHEIVLTEKLSPTSWKALIKNVAKLKFPEELKIEGSEDVLRVSSPDEVSFSSLDAVARIESFGRIPLPPYIKRDVVEADRERYQPVWAQGPALSSAAPTASLHFTEELWESLSKQIQSADTYLHVGRGTFEPLRTDDLSAAQLHAEPYELLVSEAQKIQQVSKVLAIGTTACRLTETVADLDLRNFLSQGASSNVDYVQGQTRLFVRPGYEFKKVSALMTNFHLPQSSLFVLVSVFGGSLKLAQEAYRFALSKNYRLFSYGDASLWI
jgi:S-adenosylmethionine:tRNA ribosyltransferase-isomerase